MYSICKLAMYPEKVQFKEKLWFRLRINFEIMKSIVFHFFNTILFFNTKVVLLEIEKWPVISPLGNKSQMQCKVIELKCVQNSHRP